MHEQKLSIEHSVLQQSSSPEGSPLSESTEVPPQNMKPPVHGKPAQPLTAEVTTAPVTKAPPKKASNKTMLNRIIRTVELFCYIGIEKTQFTDLFNKIYYANYERIERKWFDYKVRSLPTRSYIDILFKIYP